MFDSLSFEGPLENKGSFEVGFLHLEAYLGKILIPNNLRKCHIIMMDCCCICKKSEKTLDPLIFHCYVARDLWNIVFQMFEVE